MSCWSFGKWVTVYKVELLGGTRGKNRLAVQEAAKIHGFDLWFRKIPWKETPMTTHLFFWRISDREGAERAIVIALL